MATIKTRLQKLEEVQRDMHEDTPLYPPEQQQHSLAALYYVMTGQGFEPHPQPADEAQAAHLAREAISTTLHQVREP